VQESEKTELWIKRYALWKLSGANNLFRSVLGFSGILELSGANSLFQECSMVFLGILEWLEGLGTTDRGSCEV
jgi:hypothetical protein